uniref:Era-like 12S mitochondrial rRNA chaperone 1 n=1 Tax=Hucho hucho TaxID=62062 RepID=A0A4W5MKL4_9TELE
KWLPCEHLDFPKSVYFPRVAINIPAPLLNVSPFLRTVFLLHPRLFITSDAFLSRLVKGKAAETDDSLYRYPASVPPNSAKQISWLSTLSNQLLGRKVFAVSKKVHTTRSRALSVLTVDKTQIILLDTPGLTTLSKVKRHQLEKSLLEDPWNTVKESDLVVIMVDVSDKWACNKLDFEVLKCLSQYPDVPAVLVLNKVDSLKSKSRLLEITADLTCGVVNGRKLQVRSVIKPTWAERRTDRETRTPGSGDEGEPGGDVAPGEGSEAQSGLSKEQLRALKTQQGWAHFKDVFMHSAVDREDVETLKVMVSIDLWHDRENEELDIAVKLYVKNESNMKMVIAREAGEDLSTVFLREVKLRLSVKVKN